MFVFDHLAGQQQRRRRNTSALGIARDFDFVLACEEALEHRHDLRQIHQSIDELIVLRIHQLFWLPYPFEQGPPMLRHQDDHADEAIGAAVKCVDPRARAMSEVGIERIVGQRPIRQTRDRVHGRNIDLLPDAGLDALVKREQAPKGAGNAGHVVGEIAGDHHRWLFGDPRPMQHAPHRNANHVGALIVRVRTVLTEVADRGHDQFGVPSAQAFGVEPQALLGSGMR